MPAPIPTPAERPPPHRTSGPGASVLRAVHTARAGPGSDGLRQLVRLASRLLQVPVAVVSLIAEDREVILAAVGLPEPWASLSSVPLAHSLCAHVVHHDGALLLFDARLDPTYREHPAVQHLGVGAYAGYPLRCQGRTVGACCVIDTTPRHRAPRDLHLLEDLTANAAGELSRRLHGVPTDDDAPVTWVEQQGGR